MKTNTAPNQQKLTKAQIQGKSGFAKLMAIENLHVTHDAHQTTASFDVQNRVLRLPVLRDMHGYVYNAFITHEVGHALYTTPQPFFDALKKVPHIYLNIVEDARIEKLMQRKFPGTRGDFRNFYKEFSSKERDFFKLDDKPMEDRHFIDRFNLYFKIGQFVKVPLFTQEEKDFIEEGKRLETFEDMVALAEKLYKHDKQQDQQNQQQQQQSGGGASKQQQGQQSNDDSQSGENGDSDEKSGSSSGDQDDTEEKQDSASGSSDGSEKEENKEKDEDQKSSDSSGKSESDSDETKQDGAKAGSDDSEKSKETSSDQASAPVAPSGAGETQKSFDENFAKQAVKTADRRKVIMDDFAEFYYKDYVDANLIVENKIMDRLVASYNTLHDEHYAQFMTTIAPTIDLMVSLFNMRKQADDYYKTQEAKSGKIDMDKLAEYKFNDDIFLRSQVIPDSKNHGLVMMIDWSGSMDEHLFSTVKQLLILLEFCKKLCIPFEVYGFTSGGGGYLPVRDGILPARGGVTMFRLLTSSLTTPDYRKAVKFLYHCARTKSCATNIHGMGGTPLNGAIFASKALIENFRAKYKVQKTIFTILSDGGAGDYSMMNGAGTVTHGTEVIMRDRQTYEHYTDIVGVGNFFHTLAEYAKESSGAFKFLGYYLTSSLPDGEVALLYKNARELDIPAFQNEFTRSKFVEFPKQRGFDAYYAINISNFGTANVKLNLDSYKTEEQKGKEIQKFLNKNSKALMFMKFFIDQIV